ncbi:MAG: hypothetical protein K2Q01_00695 [Rickettsiales bacterium]|nr:hypothetical protein [Rickettsiales bacterium]
MSRGRDREERGAQEEGREEAAARPIAIPQKLQDAYGLDKELDPAKFGEAMSEAAMPEQKYDKIKEIKAAITPFSEMYYLATLHLGPDSERTAEQYAQLKKDVRGVLEMAAKDEKLVTRLKEDPDFKDFEIDPANADKFAALIATKADDAADKARRDMVLAKRAKRADRSEGAGERDDGRGRGESVAAHEEIRPSTLPARGKPSRAPGRGEPSSVA